MLSGKLSYSDMVWNPVRQPWQPSWKSYCYFSSRTKDMNYFTWWDLYFVLKEI